MKLLAYAIISILFIGTIFFSGCSMDEFEGYIDKGKDALKEGKDKIDEVTSSEKSCQKFCESENYDEGICADSVDGVDDYDCNGGKCGYKPKVFDVSENDIECNDNYCICFNVDNCGEDEQECESRCTANGCTG